MRRSYDARGPCAWYACTHALARPHAHPLPYPPTRTTFQIVKYWIVNDIVGPPAIGDAAKSLSTTRPISPLAMSLDGELTHHVQRAFVALVYSGDAGWRRPLARVAFCVCSYAMHRQRSTDNSAGVAWTALHARPVPAGSRLPSPACSLPGSHVLRWVGTAHLSRGPGSRGPGSPKPPKPLPRARLPEASQAALEEEQEYSLFSNLREAALVNGGNTEIRHAAYTPPSASGFWPEACTAAPPSCTRPSAFGFRFSASSRRYNLAFICPAVAPRIVAVCVPGVRAPASRRASPPDWARHLFCVVWKLVCAFLPSATYRGGGPSDSPAPPTTAHSSQCVRPPLARISLHTTCLQQHAQPAALSRKYTCSM